MSKKQLPINKEAVMPKSKTERKSLPRLLTAFFLVAPFVFGLFYEWGSALAGLFLLFYLLYCRHKCGYLKIPKSSALLAVTVLASAYLFTAAWGVDKGMAVIGFVKFLPLPLFALAVAQLDLSEHRAMIALLPVAGAVMTAHSFALRFVPALNALFTVNSRLSGFFQYPNTFGLYLLLGVGILLYGDRLDLKRAACLAILLIGIFLTGSRTVFILLIITVIVSLLLVKSKCFRLTLALMMLLLLASTAVYAVLTDNLSAVGRYLTASFASSTFVGRILYFKDSIPIILTHPFGLGYLGYSFTQGAFQTGVYSVQNIHNELLQFMLDVGWIPTALLVFAAVQSFRRGDRASRMIILLTAAHCMLDFDLQFIAMDFILLTAMDHGVKEEWMWKKKTSLSVACGVIGCVFLYFGTASAIYYAGAYEVCIGMYPGYTNALIVELTRADNAKEMDEAADKILSVNKSVSTAYSAKARAAYSEGDFAAMITYKKQAIELARYSLEEYLDYFDMLYVGIRLYRENGDAYSADYCIRQLLKIPEMISDVIEGTSKLAWQIDDKPELSLPDEYLEILKQIKAESESREDTFA